MTAGTPERKEIYKGNKEEEKSEEGSEKRRTILKYRD